MLDISILRLTLEHTAPKAPNTNIIVPFMLVAEEAFPLMHYIMRTYSVKNLSFEQRTFNYYPSRACRTVENSFGKIVAIRQVLKQTICAKEENIDGVVKAAVVLHNFCIKLYDNGQENNYYCPPR